MFPHLSSWRVNVGRIQENQCKDLLKILDDCQGTKAIIWEENLLGSGNLIAQLQTLKDHCVVKMFKLGNYPIPKIDNVKNIIFITRPNLKAMDYIAANIQTEERMGSKKIFHLYFLPRQSQLCEKHLKMKGVYGSLTNIGELKCDIFALDRDLLSMELTDCFNELYAEGDPTCLYQSAEALIMIQKLFGRIPKICGKGDFAEKMWQLTKTMGLDDVDINSEKGTIDQLIILERSTDLMSVLATQLTYEGLIDEVFGINKATAQFPAENFSKTSNEVNSSDQKLIYLNSGNKVFDDLRDKNFNAVGHSLSRWVSDISRQMEERHSEKVSEIRKFVEKMPIILEQKQSVADHTTIAQLIKHLTDSSDFQDELACEQNFIMCSDVDKPCSFIEDLIAKEADLRTVLRLICMQNIAGSGLKPKVLDYYKRELVQTYGIDTLLTIANLERAGLLKLQTGTRSYCVLRKTLNLTVEDFAEVSPKDISYVHSFYAPLTIRLVEHFLKPTGWQGLTDVMSRIPGVTFEDGQLSTEGRRNSLSSEISYSDNNPKTILVFFLGGCTFAEISALRFLAKHNDVEFVIATTKIINKNSFLNSFIENH